MPSLSPCRSEYRIYCPPTIRARAWSGDTSPNFPSPLRNSEEADDIPSPAVCTTSLAENSSTTSSSSSTSSAGSTNTVFPADPSPSFSSIKSVKFQDTKPGTPPSHFLEPPTLYAKRENKIKRKTSALFDAFRMSNLFGKQQPIATTPPVFPSPYLPPAQDTNTVQERSTDIDEMPPKWETKAAGRAPPKKKKAAVPKQEPKKDEPKDQPKEESKEQSKEDTAELTNEESKGEPNEASNTDKDTTVKTPEHKPAFVTNKTATTTHKKKNIFQDSSDSDVPSKGKPNRLTLHQALSTPPRNLHITVPTMATLAATLRAHGADPAEPPTPAFPKMESPYTATGAEPRDTPMPRTPSKRRPSMFQRPYDSKITPTPSPRRTDSRRPGLKSQMSLGNITKVLSGKDDAKPDEVAKGLLAMDPAKLDCEQLRAYAGAGPGVGEVDVGINGPQSTLQQRNIRLGIAYDDARVELEQTKHNLASEYQMRMQFSEMATERHRQNKIIRGNLVWAQKQCNALSKRMKDESEALVYRDEKIKDLQTAVEELKLEKTGLQEKVEKANAELDHFKKHAQTLCDTTLQAFIRTYLAQNNNRIDNYEAMMREYTSATGKVIGNINEVREKLIEMTTIRVKAELAEERDRMSHSSSLPAYSPPRQSLSVTQKRDFNLQKIKSICAITLDLDLQHHAREQAQRWALMPQDKKTEGMVKLEERIQEHYRAWFLQHYLYVARDEEMDVGCCNVKFMADEEEVDMSVDKLLSMVSAADENLRKALKALGLRTGELFVAISSFVLTEIDAIKPHDPQEESDASN